MASQPLPKTMRAWTFTSSGKPSDILTLNIDQPTPPTPTGSNLLVKVSYAGLTSAGVNLMHDLPSFLRRRGAIPEMDFSGIVVAAGPGASALLTPETRVFGSFSPAAGLGGAGTLAEYISIHSDFVQPVPAEMATKDAAALGGLAQTALKMVETAGIEKGSRVLIHGASGGVGIMAVQFAKARGAYIVATSSKRAMGMVKSAGADEAIDYKTSTPTRFHIASHYSTAPFSAILDAVGSASLYHHSPSYLTPHGHFVCVGSMEDKSQLRTITRWVKCAYTPRVLGGTPRKFSMFAASVTPEGTRKLRRRRRGGRLGFGLILLGG